GASKACSRLTPKGRLMEGPGNSDPSRQGGFPPEPPERAEADRRTDAGETFVGVSPEAFRTMLELGNDAHAILDEQGRFLWVNHLEAERLGRSLEQLRALRVWDVDPGVTEDQYHDL